MKAEDARSRWKNVFSSTHLAATARDLINGPGELSCLLRNGVETKKIEFIES